MDKQCLSQSTFHYRSGRKYIDQTWVKYNQRRGEEREDRVVSRILCGIVWLWGHQMEFTCRVKSLFRAQRCSTHAFLVYFPSCITSVPYGHHKTLSCLCRNWHLSLHFLFYFIRVWVLPVRRRGGIKPPVCSTPHLPCVELSCILKGTMCITHQE